MAWINTVLRSVFFRYDAERRSVGILSERELMAEINNPVGMTYYSHGIHPVENISHEVQVSLETPQRQSIFASTFFTWFKTVFGPSQRRFLFLTSFHPRLKSRATFGRPFRDFWHIDILVTQPFSSVKHWFLVEKWGLV